MAERTLNVLIVDDELPLRQELRSFPWDTCNAVLVGEAGNGEEALRFCGSFLPDVVVTDITMPIMDGMTLVRELRGRYPAIQIIMLTCHSDFHYAKEALKLGALEYILKVSMDDDELRLALRKAEEALEKERCHKETQRSRRRHSQSSLLVRLMNAETAGDADLERLDMAGVGPYRLVRFYVDYHPASMSARMAVQQKLDELEHALPNRMTWQPLGEQDYCLLLSQPPESSADLVRTLERAADSLVTELRRLPESASGEAAVHAVVGDPFERKAELSDTLAKTTRWQEALFYDGDSERRVFAGLPIPLADLTEEHKRELQEMFRKAGWDARKLCDFIGGPFREWCVKRRIQPMQLKRWLLKWQLEWLRQNGMDAGDSIGMGRISAAATLAKLIGCLLGDIAAAEQSGERTRIEIRTAKQWMKLHLHEPITLQLIAEEAGLSPHYLSRLFKEETGESVNQYLTRLRMERAVELLRTTNKKVYEIAEDVGIPNYRYFTVTFRNWTGLAPTDYKRQLGSAGRT